MSLKNMMMYTMIGGMAVYGYMKYKDGSLKRTMKNMKPMMQSMINELT